MDANNDVPTKDIGWIMAETDLLDLHCFKCPHVPQPVTHIQGTLTIDIYLGSPNALTNVVILPFGQPMLIPGDHCSLFLEFHSIILFGNALPPSHFMVDCSIEEDS